MTHDPSHSDQKTSRHFGLPRCVPVFFRKLLSVFKKRFLRFDQAAWLGQAGFVKLEPRLVLNADFSIDPGNVARIVFQDDADLTVSFDSTASEYTFELSSGNWSGSAPASPILVVNSSALSSELHISAASPGFNNSIEFLNGDAATLGLLSIDISGSVLDDSAADFQVASLDITNASMVTLGNDNTDNWSIDQFSFDTVGATSINVTNDLTVAGSNLSGNLELESAGNVAVESALSVSGTIEVTASGAITEDGDASADLDAGGLITLSAGTGIGTSTNKVDIAAGDSVSASTTNGDIQLNGLGALTVQSATANNGAAEIMSAGALTATAVNAQTANLQATIGGIAATTINTTGNATLGATTGDISTGDLISTNGSVVIDADDGNVALGQVTSGNTGTIEVTASGTITEDGDAAADLDAGGLITLSAGAGIGTSTNKVDIAAGDSVSASTNNGDIQLNGLGALIVQSATANNGAAEIVSAGALTATAVNAQTANLQATSGGIAATTINTTGNATFGATTGDISTGDLSSTNGNVVIDADDGNVELGQVTSGNTGTIDVTASGAITEDGDAAADLDAGGLITLSAGTGIGTSTNKVDIAAGDSVSVSTTNGDIQLNGLGALTVQSATANNGAAEIMSAGALTATAVNAQTANLQATSGGIAATTINTTGNATFGATTGDISTGDLSSTNGNVVIDADDGNVELGQVTSGNTGTIDVTASGAITEDGDAAADLDAGGLITLSAGTGIGTSTNKVDIAAGDSVSVSTTNGDIQLNGLGPLTVQSATANNGAAEIMSAGALTATAVNAQTANLQAASGGIAATTINTTGNATLGATTGDISTGDLSSTNGNVVIDADDGNVELGQVTSGNTGTIDVTASGAITEDGDAAADLDAGGLITLSAGTGIGTSTNKVDIAAGDSVSVSTTNGDIQLNGLGALTVQSATANNGAAEIMSAGALTATAVNAQTANLQATSGGIAATTINTTGNATFGATTGDISTGDLSSTNGNVVIDADDGNVELGQVTSGNTGTIDVTASGAITEDGDAAADLDAGGLITLSAGTGIGTSTNKVDIAAGDSVSVSTTNGDIQLNGLGPLTVQSATANNGAAEIMSAGALTATAVNAQTANLQAASGGIAATTINTTGNATLGATTGDISTGDLSSTNGNVVIDADDGNVELGQVTSGNTGTIEVSASGTITEDGDAVADLDAGGLITLSAVTGIGTSTNKVDIAAGDSVSASTTNGDIQLNGLGALTVQSATANNGAAEIVSAGALTATAVNAQTANLQATSGGIAATTINTTGNATFGATTGDISTGDLSSTNGNVVIDADDGNVELGQVTSGNTGTIDVTASGAITEDGDAAADLDAGGLITLSAGTGIGTSTNKVDIAAGDSVSVSTTNGDIQLNGLGALTVQSATANNGAAEIMSAGTLTATAVNAQTANLQATSGGVAATTINTTGNATLGATTGDISTGDLSSTNGNVVIDADDGNVALGQVTSGNTGTIEVTASGTITEDGDAAADLDAGGLITLSAGTGILGGLTGDNFVELASGSSVVATSAAGSIQLEGLGTLTLDQVVTLDGAIQVLSAGELVAQLVDSSATARVSNSVSLTATSGNVVVGLARAGRVNSSVTITAQNNILDGDTSPDDLDVSASEINLTAVAGNIGSSGNDIFKQQGESLEVDAARTLNADAGSGGVAITGGAGSGSNVSSQTVLWISDGDLDLSSVSFTGLANAVLIADADRDGNGDLLLPGLVSVTGDLRVEGNDLARGGGGPVQLQASRMLVVSNTGEDLALANATANANPLALDVRVGGILNITTSGAVELVDLDCDNVALMTTSGAGEITLTSTGDILVSDDVLAGADGINTSAAGIQLSAVGDLVIGDSIVSDNGAIVLQATNDVRVEDTVSVIDAADNDDDFLISTINGNISVIADADGDQDAAGGELFMDASARIIAGREQTGVFTPGTDGDPSSNTFALSGNANTSGAAIVLQADESISLGSVQTSNATSDALRVTSTSDSVLNSGVAGANLVADFTDALTTIRSVSGVGIGSSLGTQVYALDIENSSALNPDSSVRVAASGNVDIVEVGLGQDLNLVQLENESPIAATQGTGVRVVVSNGDLSLVGPTFAPNNGVFGLETPGRVDLLAEDVSILNSVAGEHVCVIANDDILVAGQVLASGDVSLQANNASADSGAQQIDGIQIQGTVRSAPGSVLIDSAAEVAIRNQVAGAVQLAVLSAGTILTSAELSATNGVYIDAGGTFEMTAAARLDGGHSVLVRSGLSQVLGEVVGVSIGLDAGEAITDANGGAVNLQGESASIRSGGSVGLANLGGAVDENPNALNTDLDMLAVDAQDGVFIREASSILVDRVAAIDFQMQINSCRIDPQSLTPTLVSETRTVASQLAALEDIVEASTGNVSLVAENGSITVSAGNSGSGITIENSANPGGLLLDASVDLRINADIEANLSNVTLSSGDDLVLAAAIEADGSVQLQARNATLDNVLGVVMSSASIIDAGGDILVATGNEGNILLSELATPGAVFLATEGSILDANGAAQNITSASVTALADIQFSGLNNLVRSGGISAGQIGTATDAIETETELLSTQSAGGVFVVNTGDLQVGGTPGVTTSTVQANGGQTNLTWAGESDVTTSANGPIQLTSMGGGLELLDGNDGDGVVLNAGDGDIRLQADSQIVAPLVFGPNGNSGEIVGNHLTLIANRFVSLPNTAVDSLEVQILDANNRVAGPGVINLAASQTGTEFLEELGPRRLEDSLQGLRGGESYGGLRRAFAFENRFADGYALLIRNQGDLAVESSELALGIEISGEEPGVYIETFRGSELEVASAVQLRSSTTEDPGIVLISGNDLEVTAPVTTEVVADPDRLQRVVSHDLNATVHNAGLRFSPLTTRLVLPDTPEHRATGESDDTHVDQRVSANFGNPGEIGFFSLVSFADSTYQVFDVGEEVAEVEGDGYTLTASAADPTPITAFEREAALFARSNDLGDGLPLFRLRSSEPLSTEIIIRRSLDFFMFSTEDDGSFEDLAIEFSEVEGVASGQTNIGLNQVVDLDSPEILPRRFTEAVEDLTPQVLVVIPQFELGAMLGKPSEVAIYPVDYADLDADGQVAAGELPSFENVLEQTLDEEEKDLIEPSKAGKTPTQEDISRVKQKLMNNPEQPSGAYAIIRTSPDGEKTVLEVFGIRDWDENESDASMPQAEDVELPDLQLQESDPEELELPTPSNSDELGVIRGDRVESEDARPDSSVNEGAASPLLASVLFGAWKKRRRSLARNEQSQTELESVSFSKSSRRRRKLNG